MELPASDSTHGMKGFHLWQKKSGIPLGCSGFIGINSIFKLYLRYAPGRSDPTRSYLFIVSIRNWNFQNVQLCRVQCRDRVCTGVRNLNASREPPAPFATIRSFDERRQIHFDSEKRPKFAILMDVKMVVGTFSNVSSNQICRKMYTGCSSWTPANDETRPFLADRPSHRKAAFRVPVFTRHVVFWRISLDENFESFRAKLSSSSSRFVANHHARALVTTCYAWT